MKEIKEKPKSTVRAGKKEGRLLLVMDEKIDRLRKEIWKAIFKNRGDLLDCDVAMALGLVQYELIHHTKRNWVTEREVGTKK